MNASIYVLKDECGRVRYVGKTVRSVAARFRSHMSEARRGCPGHKCNWIRSMISRGFIPSAEVIETVRGDGCAEESRWISMFRDSGVVLVNATDGGDGAAGLVVSDETRTRLRASHIGKGVGRQLTEEAKAKISAAHKGKRLSEAHRAALSASHLGKKQSPESNAKRSAALLGKPKSPEAIAKTAAAWIGRKHTPEAIEKMRAAHRARFAKAA